MSNLVKSDKNLPANSEIFLEEYNVGKCIRKYSKTDSSALALKSGAPSLANVMRTYGDDYIIAYIAMWLIGLNDFLNIKRKLNDPQIEELSFMLYQEYYYLNLADINLIFRKIKRGDYGQMYESIDGHKLLLWFEEYSSERARVAANDSERMADTFKQDLPRQCTGSLMEFVNTNMLINHNVNYGYNLQTTAKKGQRRKA
jgi:hypothetical protein